MKRFFSKTKHKKIVFVLSIIVAVITLNVFVYPAYADDINLDDDVSSDNITVETVPQTRAVSKMAKNNGLTPIKTVSTKDYIEINLYDYGTNINDNNLNKGVYNGLHTYPGFTQSRGQQVFDFTQFSDEVIKYYGSDILNNSGIYYLGDTIVKDLNAKDPAFVPSGYNDTTLNSTADGTINRPLNDEMNPTLVNGYPYFDVNHLGVAKGSLDYLFSQNTYATKYGNLDGLFQYDENTGLYYYSSRDNHAELVGSEFKVYNQIVTPDYMKYPFGNFLPFNSINTQATQVSSIKSSTLRAMINSAKSKSGTQYKKIAADLNAYDVAMTAYKGSNYTSWDTISMVLDLLRKNNFLNLSDSTKTELRNNLPNLYTIDYDEEKNFFFGFDMKLNFMQTKDGMTGKNRDQKMVFRFEGDDDVWVYIEDTLFLDLSGIHGQVGGEIDFHDGVVRYYSFNKETFSAGNSSSHLIKTVKFQDILGTDSPLLENVGNGVYRFKEYSTPELRFYYIERGASSGVMTTMFNLPLINEQAITIGKEVTSSSNALGNPEYQFQVMKSGSTDQLFVGANYAYDVYDSETDTKLRSEKTDSNGIIKLHNGEYAIIDGIKENAGKYYVRELIDKNESSQYSSVTIDGTKVTISSSTVSYGSKEYVYASSGTKDMYDAVRVTNFVNNISNKLAKLSIKKSLGNNTSDVVKNDTFKVKVEIDGVLLAIGTQYKIGNNTYSVDEVGIVKLKPTQEAIIDGILSNSSFKIVEVLDSTSGLVDSYKLNGKTVDTKYVSGIVSLDNVVSVEVINTEKDGISIDIPVSKTTSNADGVNYTYTFILKDVDNDKILSTKTITVDANGNGSNSKLFTIGYSQLAHSSVETIHNYKVYEEKSTTLGSTKVSNDVNTLYDSTVYDVQVKVVNNASGFTATPTIKKNGNVVSNIVFNNKRLASLTIKKMVENSPNDKTKFNFNIESTGLADGTYKTSGSDITFSNGQATVKLSKGESITIYGLPYGSTYNVTETNRDGYTVMYEVDSSGLNEGDRVTDITLLKKTDQNSAFNLNYDTTVTFTNVKGYELPKTGSNGVLLLTSIGIILMSIASVCTLKLKKKEGEI